MANTIANVYIQTFDRNVRFLAQQTYSKFLPLCQTKPGPSSKHNFERVGTLSASTKAGRAVASPVNDTPWSRRVVTPVTKHAGDLIEPEDAVQMLIDPASNITKVIAMAMARAIDDIIIAAATGNAVDGAGGNNAFPAGQVVGDGTGAISLALATQVQEKFLTNDIDADVPKTIVIGPVQARQLLAITQATSADYVNAKALSEKGVVENWLGFRWMVSTRLAIAAGVISCLAVTDRALGWLMDKDIWSRAEEDPSRSFAVQVYSAFTGGAVRVEDEQIVHFKLLNS